MLPSNAYSIFVYVVFVSICGCNCSNDAIYTSGVSLENSKRQVSSCNEQEQKYRRSDGQCNNLINPQFGSASSEFRRLLTANSEGGRIIPRTTGTDGSPLPSARTVSLNCHTKKAARGPVTQMVMLWGQFISHDINLSLGAPLPPGTECCSSDHPDCFSIPLKDDPYFFDRDCMSFRRSRRVVPPGKKVEEQVNGVTAFIDASTVYGSNGGATQALRGENGELREVSLPLGKYLPKGSPSRCEAKTDEGEYCFKAGDIRVNSHPGLSSMHTIWLREHNRIVRHLRKNHNDWDSDTLFEEARRILVGMVQAITYNEYLPVVLGDELMSFFDLKDDTYTYNDRIQANIISSFATAAYRFGHSTIPEEINVNGQSLELKNLWFRTSETFKSLDGVIEGGYKDLAMKTDMYFSHSVTRHMFQTRERDGFDLVSFNIQRGRDHGLPSYTQFRRAAREESTTLRDLFPNDPECQSIYKSIDDVDLYTGGLAEPPVKGGIVGSLFAHIMGFQFLMLKEGDRFFYLNPQGPQAFTPAQREMFKKVSLSRVICDNTENFRVPRNVFKPVSNINPEVDCSDIPSFNLDIF